jgi:hypothetical protein
VFCITNALKLPTYAIKLSILIVKLFTPKLNLSRAAAKLSTVNM